MGGPARAVVALAVLVAASPTWALADVAAARSARTIVRTTPCSDGGTITTTIERTSRRLSVGFELSGAWPLEEYGFGAEWDVRQSRNRFVSGSYDGVTQADLLGDADLAGFGASPRAQVTYRFFAGNGRNSCVVRGTLPAR